MLETKTHESRSQMFWFAWLNNQLQIHLLKWT